MPPTRWGRWVRRGKHLLIYQDGRVFYSIPLRQLRTSAAVLDWIYQVTAKRWSSPQDSMDLIEALRDVVDPQRNLCAFGVECGAENRWWVKQL